MSRPMARTKLAILISGRGSNMEALIKAARSPDYPAEVALVVSNVPTAKGLGIARRHGVETLVVDHREYQDRESFENALQLALEDAGIELVCLAGFMRILNADFVMRWRDRMLNVHPSLLPAYRGLRTHERALEDGVRFTGCTVHFVRPEMDSGPILLQAAIPVHPEDTPATLAKRVLGQEHRIFVEAVRLVAGRHVRVSGNKVIGKTLRVPKEGLISPCIES